MKKILLLAVIMSAAFAMKAVYWLPTPEITSEVKDADGNYTVTWDYDDVTEPCTYFEVVVYKMHVATQEEEFPLASSDFCYISSTGTQDHSEERGATWDYLSDNPGWWVKFPKYMEGAIGIDTFNYFYGSDNDDIFGGAYMISPDYDLSHLSGDELHISARLGNEALSVSGGFCLWAYNTNWYDPSNVDYKPVAGNDYHYTDLDQNTWKEVSEVLTLPSAEGVTDEDILEEINGMQRHRCRVMFYGKGYSCYWIKNFALTAPMVAGDMVDYGATYIHTTAKTATIDTSADTPTDYTYAVEVRAVRRDFDEYRDRNYLRFTNYPYATPKHVFADRAGVDAVRPDDGTAVDIRVESGAVVVSGTASMTIRETAGRTVYSGTSSAPVSLPAGLYIVTAGTRTAKVAVK